LHQQAGHPVGDGCPSKVCPHVPVYDLDSAAQIPSHVYVKVLPLMHSVTVPSPLHVALVTFPLPPVQVIVPVHGGMHAWSEAGTGFAERSAQLAFRSLFSQSPERTIAANAAWQLGTETEQDAALLHILVAKSSPLLLLHAATSTNAATIGAERMTGIVAG
jgi:hypothetical protein